MTTNEPTAQWWAYGGIRVLHTERMVVWLPEAGNGEELLFFPERRSGSFTVGLIYRVWASHAEGRIRMHGVPGEAHGRVEPTLAALLRAEHHAAQARLALVGLKPPPLGRIAVDEAIEPVRAIARGLTDRADRTALLAHVVAELSSALPSPSPHGAVTGDG